MPTATTLPRLPRRYFGVELETHSGDIADLADHHGFQRKSDCSISGWEFTTPKLMGRDGLRKLRAFMQAGVGMRVNRECGLHTHYDMRGTDLTHKQLYTVWAAYLATEDNWFSRVSRSRQHNEYCHRMYDRTLGEVLESAKYRDEFMVRGHDRYNWINVGAYNNHGTFENRLHQGSWNFTKIRNWVVLNLRFIKASARINVGGTTTLAEFAEKAQAALVWAAATQAPVPSRLAA